MPPPDFSARKDVRKAEKLAAQADANRIAYTRRIMSEVEGRAWMHNLLTRCHVFATPFVRGAADLTAFNCGEQNIGYQTFSDVVNHSPVEYIQMMQEANQKDLTNAARRQQPPATDLSGQLAGSPEPGRDDARPEPDLDPAVWDGVEDEYGRVPGTE